MATTIPRKAYLGDGCYIEWSPGEFRLYTEGGRINQEIYLDESMVRALVKYVFPDKELVDVVAGSDSGD